MSVAPVDHSVLRAVLMRDLGEEQFKKFIAGGVRAPMRFWQEKAWERFKAKHPELAVGDVELEEALRICEVHWQRLERGTVAVNPGHLDLVQDYVNARRTLFPHAAQDPIGAEQEVPEHVIHTWFCPACREARAAWMPERRK